MQKLKIGGRATYAISRMDIGLLAKEGPVSHRGERGPPRSPLFYRGLLRVISGTPQLEVFFFFFFDQIKLISVAVVLYSFNVNINVCLCMFREWSDGTCRCYINNIQIVRVCLKIR